MSRILNLLNISFKFKFKVELLCFFLMMNLTFSEPKCFHKANCAGKCTKNSCPPGYTCEIAENNPNVHICCESKWRKIQKTYVAKERVNIIKVYKYDAKVSVNCKNIHCTVRIK